MAKHESKYAGCRLFRRLYNKISTTYFLLKLIDNKNEFSVGKKNFKKKFLLMTESRKSQILDEMYTNGNLLFTLSVGSY